MLFWCIDLHFWVLWLAMVATVGEEAIIDPVSTTTLGDHVIDGGSHSVILLSFLWPMQRVLLLLFGGQSGLA